MPAAEDNVPQRLSAEMSLGNTSSGELRSCSNITSRASSLVNLAEEQINHAEEPNNEAISGESSLTPVQWEAWSLPTETWGHYESATDLTGGSCQDFATSSGVSPQREQEESSPRPLTDIGRRLASLPNLSEAAETPAQNCCRKLQDKQEDATKCATGITTSSARRRKTTATSTGSSSHMPPRAAAESTATAEAASTPTSITSIEQLKIRTLQAEVHRLQSQILNLQTTHERTLKSSTRYKSKCTQLQAQLDHTQAENDHLRQEVQDLRTLVKLEEEARLAGAIDALLLDEQESSPTPPIQIEVEMPTPPPTALLVSSSTSSSLIKDSSILVDARTRRHSLDTMELSRLERHDFTNRVA